MQRTAGRCVTSSQHVYEVRPRKDHRGVDLISDALPFGRLWYGEPNAVSNAIDYAKFRSRSHDAVIRVYDSAGNVIEKSCLRHLRLSAFSSLIRRERSAHTLLSDGHQPNLGAAITIQKNGGPTRTLPSRVQSGVYAYRSRVETITGSSSGAIPTNCPGVQRFPYSPACGQGGDHTLAIHSKPVLS